MSTRSESKSDGARPARIAVTALAAQPRGARVRLCGRVVDARGCSLLLEDASGRVRLEAPEPVAPGRLCEVEGTLADDGVRVSQLRELGGSERVFRAGSDYQRLHGEGPAPVARLRDRARLLHAVRDFFAQRDYLEVETPQAVPSPGLDLHLSAFSLREARAPRWLITSPEYQMKRLLSAGAERIFQISRCFRRDESGALHEPEFSMLEWYRAHASLADMLDETEALVRHVVRAACPEAPALRVQEHAVGVEPRFERLTVRQAFARHADADADHLAHDPDQFYRVLIERVEPALGRERPTFLTHYPASMASLARLSPDDPSVAERFELYVAGVELCNGFGELTCPVEQRARLEADRERRAAAGLDVYPIDERFLEALEAGVPPSAGNALGLDRLFMLALGLPDIQAILSFPDSTL